MTDDYRQLAHDALARAEAGQVARRALATLSVDASVPADLVYPLDSFEFRAWEDVPALARAVLELSETVDRLLAHTERCAFFDEFNAHADMLGDGYPTCCTAGPDVFDLMAERDRYRAMWDDLRAQYVDPAAAAHGDSWLELYMASIEARHPPEGGQ